QGQLQDWAVDSGFAIFFANATQVEAERTESFELFENLGFRKRITDLSFSTQPLQWLGMSATYGWGTNINYSPAAGVSPFLANSADGSFVLTLRPTHQLRLDVIYFYTHLGTRTGFTPTGTPASSIFNNHLLRWKLNYQFTRALS